MATNELSRLAPAVERQTTPDGARDTWGSPIIQEDLKFVVGKPVHFEETRHYEFKEVMGRNPVDSIKNTCDEYVVAFLNAEGGRILWGIRNADRCVVGVKLHANERDHLRRLVIDQLLKIRPPVAPTAYRISLHPVYADDVSTEPLPDLFIVEILAPSSDSFLLHATGGNEIYVRTDAGKKKLTPEEI